MKWIKTSTTKPPTDGTTVFALFNDTPCLIEYATEDRAYIVRSIDPLPTTIKKLTPISHWMPIEKP